MTRRLKAYVILISVAAIWGAAGPIIKFTLGGIDPLPFLAYRLSISAIFSVVFFLIKVKRGKHFRRLKAHLPLAIFYGLLAVPIGLGILFVALDNASVLDLTLIGVIGPLITTGGAAILYHDHITRRERAGILIVLFGVILNSLIPLFTSETKIYITGNLLLLLYLVADSGSVLVAKRAIRLKIKPANLTNLAFIIGAVTLIPLVILVYGAGNTINMIVLLPLKYHLGVWYMALFSGNLAYYLYVRGQRSIEVSEAVLFNYLQPLFMIPLAIFWLRETITPHFLIGAIVIAIGLFIAESKKRKSKSL